MDKKVKDLVFKYDLSEGESKLLERDILELIESAKKEEREKIAGKWIDFIANVTLTEQNGVGLDIANDVISRLTVSEKQ